jgi:hypothetical protein
LQSDFQRIYGVELEELEKLFWDDAAQLAGVAPTPQN